MLLVAQLPVFFFFSFFVIIIIIIIICLCLCVPCVRSRNKYKIYKYKVAIAVVLSRGICSVRYKFQDSRWLVSGNVDDYDLIHHRHRCVYTHLSL